MQQNPPGSNPEYAGSVNGVESAQLEVPEYTGGVTCSRNPPSSRNGAARQWSGTAQLEVPSQVANGVESAS